MANPIPSWLVVQYIRAKKNGWIPSFRDAAAKHSFTLEDVLGVASRESNMQNIKGDFRDGKYHGYSLMQLDIGSHPKFIASEEWRDAKKAIEKGVAALAEKRDLIIKASKQKAVTIKFRSGKSVKFTPKPFNDEQLRRMTIASYNCGLASYYHFSLGNDIDRGTTGKNYSADVLERSKDFKDLIDRDNLGKSANDRAISTLPTPEPTPNALQTTVDFDQLKGKVQEHATLVQSDSAKSIFAKLGLKIGGGLASIWGTTGGKIALVLSALLIAGVVAYTIYKYRTPIKSFLTGLKAWAFKGVVK